MAVIDSKELGEDGIVHFRVRALGPSPFAQLMSRSGEVLFEIETLVGNITCGHNYSTLGHTIAPYEAAIREAIATQAIYWVDWSRPQTPVFPYRSDDSNLDRLLKAIQERQFLPDQD